jgi:pimeloyl-ACP methyl ester carboxylesterase
MSTAEQLGEVSETAVTDGTIRYRERGDGPSVLFVHGVLVNGDLWRNVVPRVADTGFHCITPDLPLGSHELPMDRDADLSPPALARMVVELIDRLGLDRPIVVANDTGGALTQIAMAEHGDELGPVVLTSCDAFENFFPPLFRYLSAAARIPGSALMLGQTMRFKLMQRTPIAFGWLTREAVPAEFMESYGAPVRRSAGVRRDVTKVLRGINRRHTLAAARKLSSFDRPVLLAWADDGKVFPMADAKRLEQILPNVRLEVIEDSYAFVPEDQPERLAELIVEFAAASRLPDAEAAPNV